MLRLFAVAADLARQHFTLMSGHAKARAVQTALAGVFAFAAIVFLLVLATAALAERFGALQALAIMAGANLVACGIMLLVIRAGKRRHRALQRSQSEEDRRVMQAALLGAAPTFKRGGLVAAVGGALLLGLVARARGRRSD